MKFKCYCAFCFLLISLSGCVSQKLDEATEQIGELSLASLIYYGHKDSWPSSIDELKIFCSENQEECPSLDWNKYTQAHFEAQEDGSLKLKFCISNNSNNSSDCRNPNVVLRLPKPIIQKNQNGNSTDN